AVPLAPAIDALFAHAMTFGDLGHRVLIRLAQNPHDLLFAISGLLHRFHLSLEAIFPKLRRYENPRAGQDVLRLRDTTLSLFTEKSYTLSHLCNLVTFWALLKLSRKARVWQ